MKTNYTPILLRDGKGEARFVMYERANIADNLILITKII